MPRTHLTSVLIGKDHILGGWWSKIEVTQVLGMSIWVYGCVNQPVGTLGAKASAIVRSKSDRRLNCTGHLTAGFWQRQPFSM